MSEEKRRQLIVTADDVGLTHDVNRAAREARDGGVVTQVSVTAAGRALEEAAAWIRSDPGLGVGVHLDLSRFFRFDPGRTSAVWPFQDPRIPVPAILDETAAQIKTLADRKFQLSFLTSRHQLHLRPEILPLVCDVALAYGIRAVRFSSPYLKGYKGDPSAWLREMLERRGVSTAPHYIDGWYWGNVDEAFARAELACRPSHADDAGRRDLAACCDPRLREHLRRQNMELVAIKDILPQVFYAGP